MSRRLGIKLLLAAVSGGLCGVVWFLFDDFATWHEWLPFYGLSGLFFAVGVLWPYLRRDQNLYMRAAVLVLASILSYWCAIQTALGWNDQAWGPSYQDIGLASIVGTAIVWASALIIVPFRWSTQYGLLGVAAALVGGLLFYLGMEVSNAGLYLSYMAWHLATSVAIHFSRAAGPETTLLSAF